MRILLALLALAIVGCDHSNNAQVGQSQEPPSQDNEDTLPDASRAQPSLQEALPKHNSSITHFQNLRGIARRMLRDRYLVDEQGTPLTELTALGRMIGGVSHIYPPDRYPYKMEWRLMVLGGQGANDLPASFLMAQCDRRFTHDVAVDVIKEFTRVATLAVPTSQVTTAMRSAEGKFKRIRRVRPNALTSWFVSSDLEDAEAMRAAGDEYAVRVDIREWPPEDYIRENGACRVTVYFVYLPPHREIDLSKVTRSGL